ncbi:MULTISPECIES: hypothetical protein [unclassified Clostridium]|uniref:hypothetical protein n=1 Tax=unclassified Clostridium TaxID=2614128 RepID=UPI0025BE5BD3|nr:MULTISPECIES: hypothetical protein [unclassified Clostridium]
MSNIFEQIADYIVKNTQQNSVESGFQYITYYSEIEKKFNVKIDKNINNKILTALEDREEIADVQEDISGYDVVLFTSYAPNYNSKEFEEV